MTRSTDEILEARAAAGGPAIPLADIPSVIAAENADPHSKINLMRAIVARLRRQLGVDPESEAGEAIGDAILRGVWIGEGNDPELILSEDDPLHNVTPLPGIEMKLPENVIELSVVTAVDIPIDRILRRAGEANLSQVLVLGYEQDGELYTAASFASGPEMLWMLRMAEKRLIEIGDPVEASSVG